ncbi:hypothetical protein CEB3_c15250 [Peptococcaceae bacterium CEB3]|nr:hypothetical protein CEB3_c15250 [Peptococcaceae bacterium CEB3]
MPIYKWEWVPRIGIAVVVVVFVVINIFDSSKPPVYTITDGSFSISSAYGQKIDLSDIKEIQLKDYLPGSLFRTNGLGAGTVLKGKFSSDIGNVILYVNTSIPGYIYIRTKSEQVILNNQSKEKTEDLYKKLSTQLSQ